MDSARILIVEDESFLAMELSVRLERLGYRVAGIADSGEAALSLAEKTHPDLALMDVVLGGAMDGIQAARLLRERFDLPVIYVTGQRNEEILTRIGRSEPYGYLSKPCKDRELRVALDMALNRLAAERRLKQNERWLETMLRSIEEGVIATDQSGRVKYFNANAAALTGWTESEAIGRPLSEVVRIEMDGLSDRRRLIAKNGLEILVQEHISSILDERGQVLGDVLVMRDVTMHLRMEEQVFMEQKLAAVGTLASGLAHDFNNVLTVIAGYAEDLLGQEGSSAIRQDLDKIRNAAERGGQLTQQLLAFGRKQLLQPVVLDLNTVLLDLEPMLRRMIGEDSELLLSLQSGLPLIKADPIQLKQVLMGLAVYARDSMNSDGWLRIRTSNVVLGEEFVGRPVSMAPGRYAALWMTDSGPGLDETTRQRVFEPFFTTKGLGRGSGLGLSTVYGTVKQSGGHIWVESESGQGTTFVLHFPASVEPSPSLPQVVPATNPVQGAETILVVEDEEILRNMIFNLLKKNGYQVLCAKDGEDAMRIGQAHPGALHLILSDVVMPGISGLELIRRFESLRPGVKVLFLSGYPVEEIARYGLSVEGRPFLEKPYRSQVLLQKLRQVLDNA